MSLAAPQSRPATAVVLTRRGLTALVTAWCLTGAGCAMMQQQRYRPIGPPSGSNFTPPASTTPNLGSPAPFPGSSSPSIETGPVDSIPYEGPTLGNPNSARRGLPSRNTSTPRSTNLPTIRGYIELPPPPGK